MAINRIESSNTSDLFGDRVEMYAYIVILIVVTSACNWWLNSRTGNPVNGHVFDENDGLRNNAYAESVIQLDEIKKGNIGNTFDLDYKKLQVKYDKVKNEWNKENP